MAQSHVAGVELALSNGIVLRVATEADAKEMETEEADSIEGDEKQAREELNEEAIDVERMDPRRAPRYSRTLLRTPLRHQRHTFLHSAGCASSIMLQRIQRQSTVADDHHALVQGDASTAREQTRENSGREKVEQK